MKLFNKILEDETGLKRKGTYMYGQYNGFNIVANITNLAQATSTLVISVSIKSDLENYKEKVNEYLNNLDKSKLGITFTQVNDHFCEIHIASAFQGKMIKQANEFLTKFVEFLKAERFESGCQLCEVNSDIGTYELGGTYSILCNDCASKIQNQCEEERISQANKKSNVITGIVGALIGSLIGVLAWVIIYNLGYIASLAGLITVVCAMKGYEKLGKHLDTKGVIISVIISVLMIYLANQTAWAIEIVNVFNQAGQQISFFDAYRNLFDILKEIEMLSGDNNIISAFYGDLVMGYVLSAIAIIPYIMGVLKAIKVNTKLTKLD